MSRTNPRLTPLKVGAAEKENDVAAPTQETIAEEPEAEAAAAAE